MEGFNFLARNIIPILFAGVPTVTLTSIGLYYLSMGRHGFGSIQSGTSNITTGGQPGNK